MVTMLTSHGFQVDTTWFAFGQHVVSMWTLCGFHVDPMWFPGGYHIISRSLQLLIEVENLPIFESL